MIMNGYVGLLFTCGPLVVGGVGGWGKEGHMLLLFISHSWHTLLFLAEGVASCMETCDHN